MTATANSGPRLERETFRTSRLAEFANRRELTAQVGHPVEDWPVYLLKELIDNAIDIAEEVGAAPEVAVHVSTASGEIAVTDNGSGTPAEVVDAVTDYRFRTSSRAGYVGPSRGQQGQALSTILPMRHVLGGTGEAVVVESLGIRHGITFAVDPVTQEPRVSCARGGSTVRTGTKITVRWPSTACDILTRASDRFLPFAWDFVAVNPHLALTLDLDGRRLLASEPTDPGWRKWRPSDPLVAHWYTPETLQRLIASCVNADRERGERARSVRDFVAGFRGLAGTKARSAVLAECDLFRAPLDVFFDRERADRGAISGLLGVMRQHSRPPKPEALGVIGAGHFREVLGVDAADQERFRYACVQALDKSGGALPFVVEACFAPGGPSMSTGIVQGINWSAAIRNPFRGLGLYRRDYCIDTLQELLWERHVENDDVLVGVHLATPVAQFTDRGKSSAALTPAMGRAVVDAVARVTKQHAAAWEARQRAKYRRDRAVDRAIEAEERERKRQRRSAEARARLVGTGVLYREIAAAAEIAGVSVSDLTVLSPGLDPFRRDTTDGHRDARWFAAQLERLVPAAAAVHLRGLFYRIVAAGDVRRPDGSPFVNDYDCWTWLQKSAAKAGRWLGYVPFERIRDERNEAPLAVSFAPDPMKGSGHLVRGLSPEVPGIDALLPAVGGTAPVAAQPYRIILVGEKSSLAEVLAPVAETVRGELLLPTGELSDTMIAEMAHRAAADRRPSVVLYFADFDPSGHQMPISLARKLQALRVLRHPDLRIDVHRVALTLDQVRTFNLPSTPLKPTEKRAEKWRARMGHEQTEIDALAALRPADLRRVAHEAVKPFFDATLERRCEAAIRRWRDDAKAKLDAHPAWPAIRTTIEAAHADLDAAAGALDAAQDEAIETLREGDGGIREASLAAPEAEISAAAPSPLFSSTDDFVAATRKLIASKALDDVDDGDAPQPEEAT